MKGYSIFIQPADGGEMHRVDVPYLKEAQSFAKWINRSTGAAVGIVDLRTYKTHSTIGDFDEERL